MKKNQLLLVLVTILSLTQGYAQQRVLFVRGGTGSGGFLEGGSNEQLADINNFQTFNGNHGWGTFAETLENEGYTLTQITEGRGGNSPVDFADINLNQYDIIVLGSNNASYNNTQVDAIDNWVKNGGGLLTISDANFGSSWCDAPNSDQDFLDRYGILVHQDFGTYSLRRSSNDFIISDHPILNNVDRFDGEGVSPFITANTIPSGVTVERIVRARNEIRRNNTNNQGSCQGSTRNANNNDAVLMTATSGNGRVVAHFDRNTFFNQNGAGTNINRFDNKRYMLNVFKWLSEAGNNNNPISQSAYEGINALIPGTIQAENYDLGGQGVAYNDTSQGNRGNQYRNDNVDIRVTDDTGGGHQVGWTKNGEWLEYTTNVTAGTYNIELRASSNANNPGSVNIELDNVNLGTINIEDTNSWNTFMTFNLNNISIAGGENKILRLSIIEGNLDLNFIRFSPVANTTQSAFANSNALIPGTIEAENYDLGGQGVAYNDTNSGNTGDEYRNDRVDITTTQDSGGGHKVGWIANGEWLEYTTNVTAGTYNIELRASSANSNPGEVQVEIDGAEIGTIDIEQTNGWESFVTYNLNNITISGGNDRVLRLLMIGGRFDLNFIKFTEVSSSTDFPIINAFTGVQQPNVADNILDGNDGDTSRWSINGFPQSVIIDYGSERNFTGSRIWTYQNRAYRYRVFVSNNPDSDFIEVVNRSDNNNATQPITDDFNAVSGRYVKLMVTGASNYSGSWVSITEVDMIFTDNLSKLTENSKIKDKKALKVYPNPSEVGIFYLSEKRTWTVYNILGIKIRTGNSKAVNLSVYSKGIYFLKTENETKQLVIK